MSAALAKTIAGQERRYAHLVRDAQFIRRCREIDKLKGIEWDSVPMRSDGEKS